MIDLSVTVEKSILQSSAAANWRGNTDCEIFEISKSDKIKKNINYFRVIRVNAGVCAGRDRLKEPYDAISVCVCYQVQDAMYPYIAEFYVLLKNLNTDERSLRSLGIEVLKLWQEESDFVHIDFIHEVDYV
jgi:hypothetical protein